MIGLALLVAGCGTPAGQTEQIDIEIIADGKSYEVLVPTGSTTRQALEAAGVEVGLLDRTEPRLAHTLSDEKIIRVIRISEEFEIDEVVLPFERRILRNESLAEHEQRLIQAGANGLAEVTFRVVYEEGEAISRTAVREQVVLEPVEEILMVGTQAPASALSISGHLVFLSAGNAWLIEANSGLRRPLVASGDLDGRIFSVSPDGAWLLFSRESEAEEEINTLWVVSLDEEDAAEIDLRVANVVHFADWVPGSGTQIAFSTVEVELGPPGWQANNDLQVLTLEDGRVSGRTRLLSSRADSLYSWWGSEYAYGPDGEQIAFSRPDSVGLVDVSEDELIALLELLSYQTESEWAWMPGLSWAADGSRLYSVLHAEQAGLQNQERSPIFDLVAIDPDNGDAAVVVRNVGIFAHPQSSPLLRDADESQSYLLAFLAALNPAQSDVSDYQVFIFEPDEGQARLLFPPNGAAGLSPQRVAWSPAPADADSSLSIALVYQSNLWIVDASSGSAQQITADGSVTRVAWGP